MRHLVTGATSGIGRAVATRLRDRGDELILLVRDPSRVTGFPDAKLVVADLADLADLAESGESGPWDGLALPDRLDSVVHAAGVVELGTVAELTPEAWRAQLEVNLLAPALLTRAALPAVRAAGGTVVFVNSGAGLSAGPRWSGYAASKFGLRALADALRAEEPQIRVTTVFPGRTATPMQEKVHGQEDRAYDGTEWIRPETVAAAIVDAIDLGRDATMPEIVLRPR